MASVSTETFERTRLVEAYYDKVSPLQQRMVQLFSVIYEPISRAAFTDCFNHIGARDRGGNLFTSQSLKPHIDALLGLGLLVQEAGRGPACHPMIAEIATRDLVRAGHFDTFVSAIEEKLPLPSRWKGGPQYFSNDRQLIRQVRIGMYRNDIEWVQKQFEIFYSYQYFNPISPEEVFYQICNNPFDVEWFRALSPELYEIAIVSILNYSMLNLTPANEAFSLLLSDAQRGSISDESGIALFEQLILRGRLIEAEQIFEQLSESCRSNVDNLRGMLAFLRGDNEQAIAHYTAALQLLKKGAGKRKVYFQSMSGLFLILALLKQGSPEELNEAANYTSIGRQAKHWLSATYGVLESVVKIQQGDLSQKEMLPYAAPQPGQHSLEILLRALCLYWIDVDAAKSRLPKVLEWFYQQADAAGYDWLGLETAELLARFKPRSNYSKAVTAGRQAIGTPALADIIRPQEAWEYCLTALVNLRKESEPPPITKSAANLRLAWFVTFYPSRCVLQPREQSLNAKGEWSKGRPIALKRLKNDANDFAYLTAQDRQVCSHIKMTSYGWGNKTDYTFSEKAIVALVDHPLVFWEDSPTTRIEVIKGEPELLVQRGKSHVALQFVPELKDNTSILAVKETPTRLKVIEITPEHRRIAEVLGDKNRLEVPVSASDRVLAAITAVSQIVTVHSDIGGGVAAQEVDCDSKPHIHLLPVGDGLKVSVLSRPFATGGPYYRPGAGGATVIAEIDGKRLQTTRNLEEEIERGNAAIAACPVLVNQEEHDGEWLVESLEDCLELLLQLQTLGDEIVLEWPQGEKLRVSQQASLKNFQLTIKRQNDWFETSGKLKLDDQSVLEMQQLMQLLENSHGRFIPLSDGQFLALTQEFRKRLEDLRAFSERSGKGLRLHPLAAVAVEEWLDEVGDLKADKHWKAHMQRLKEIQNFEPTLPSTLQADLRDYQLDGFRWLSRLAHWGVGACLADDMGLGKTLQALAVILTRAPEGPTLIVAPTSVCMNWISEAQKFAPTLNVVQFGSGDRQKVLDALQPFDMLVCSYGLLQQEDVAEKLAKVEWQTIVLDEAQSIKNFATKRSQAAMNLQGAFKLLTTGTPIENHLGELWNLFRFINPGLLGSLESFNQRFAIPIERYQDKQARNRLKKLIQPFILRRTKSQVLEELPSRTEILLHVDLSQDEIAFYEALRRDAIAKLSESDAAAGTKHLQVLAEIMRLRRACCHTRLVSPDLSLPSSKLQLFGEILGELLENRHKALVFSQFVDHLHIIQAYLDEHQIRYQYLDGSTPAADRKKRVNAFQAGEGDVFLISLKAGGTGLNLTAADYVIHMDPWWNPAVEDQASDRAHRIGQQRPVTIYRLVAKNTIEEKIVNLHHHKRDLADSLLEGTDMSGKISTDDLLRLIQEG
jgi:superfamily II DNA or RNA helicase